MHLCIDYAMLGHNRGYFEPNEQERAATKGFEFDSREANRQAGRATRNAGTRRRSRDSVERIA